METLLGNPAKAAAKLGWKPEISFKDTWVLSDGGFRCEDAEGVQSSVT